MTSPDDNRPTLESLGPETPTGWAVFAFVLIVVALWFFT
jgi:hypothetical protein